MGAYFNVDGQVTVVKNDKLADIISRLEERAGNEVEVSQDDNGNGTVTVSVSGGTYASYTTAEDVEGIIKELTPLATHAARFTLNVDDEPGSFWVGDPEAVKTAAIARKVQKIKDAIDKLPADEREKLIASYIDANNWRK